MPKKTQSKNAIAQQPIIEDVIHHIRGQKVILGRDLASIYGVQTKALTQAVKRNAAKFPPDFMFQLTREEAKTAARSRSQNVTLKRGTNIKYLPYAFTEHGVVMAANVLNSDRAVTMSVYVVRAFVKLRELATGNEALERKLRELERKLTARQDIHEKAILQLFKQIRALLLPIDTKPSKRQIGFRRV
ncbi:MAG TPA: ORF6N domain-containing protein [Pyrinomonadaceae bacterium]|nr:ORF6N domain-containing protein [Pyrinomonadaceae bacterium]